MGAAVCAALAWPGVVGMSAWICPPAGGMMEGECPELEKHLGFVSFPQNAPWQQGQKGLVWPRALMGWGGKGWG